MTQPELFIEDTDKDPSCHTAKRVSVLVPYPVDKAYTYTCTDEQSVKPGDYVCVPIGNREICAVVWDDPVDDLPAHKVKAIVSHYDFLSLNQDHRKFIDWVAQYNMAPRGFVLKMTLCAPSALDPLVPIVGYTVDVQINDKTRNGLSPKRQRVLDILEDGIPRRASDIAEQADCSPGVIKAMTDKHILQKTQIYYSPPCVNPNPNFSKIDLSDDQQSAADNLRHLVKSNEFKVSLLDGVTGAGKTEVYFEAISEAISKGKQALILLPEIALSNAFLDRFKSRFGCSPALWHSSLSSSKRKSTWRGVAQGVTKVVVGARSALFLPYSDLGCIIVDEEHDSAFKQEDGVIYNARDMAVVRGHIGHFPVVLVSATPSLETITNAWSGRYNHIILPDRHGGALLPEIDVIDLKTDRPARYNFIAPSLVEEIKTNLEAGEQTLLFLNRRGYAPLTLCRDCGYRFECPRCTAWLVDHKKMHSLHCHHCGFQMKVPKSCPECGQKDSLASCGPGVERIQEEVKSIFPDVRVIVIASDTAQKNEVFRQMLIDIKDHKYDIIIGTQIIAKGHHFPKLTLVGVIDADLGLQGGDLRAAERTYQLLHQVAGRAGREDLPGRVYLQSFLPEHKVMQALCSHERNLFYEVEASEREQAHMPPYCRLVGIIVSGKDEKLVLECASELGKTALQVDGISTLGPAEAPFYRLRGNYRRRLLIRADKKVDIQKAIQLWLNKVKVPSSIRVYVDIDPQSFL